MWATGALSIEKCECTCERDFEDCELGSAVEIAIGRQDQAACRTASVDAVVEVMQGDYGAGGSELIDSSAPAVVDAPSVGGSVEVAVGASHERCAVRSGRVVSVGEVGRSEDGERLSGGQNGSGDEEKGRVEEMGDRDAFWLHMSSWCPHEWAHGTHECVRRNAWATIHNLEMRISASLFQIFVYCKAASKSLLPWRHDAECCEQEPAAVAGGGGVLHGGARHDDSEYRGAEDRRCAARGAAEYEGGAFELHAEPGGFHSDQRMDGGPVWDASGVCVGDRVVHVRLAAVRDLDKYSRSGGVPGVARVRRRDDGAGRAADDCADVCEVGVDSRNEFCRDSGVDRANAGAARRRVDRRVLALADDFFRESTDRAGGVGSGVFALAGLSRAIESAGFCGTGFVRGRDRVVVVCTGGVWRAYADAPRGSGAAGTFDPVAGGVWSARCEGSVSAARPFAVQDADIPRGGERKFFYTSRDRRDSVYSAAAVSGGNGLQPGAVGVVDDASVHRSDEPEDHYAEDPGAVWIPACVDFEHSHDRFADLYVRDDRDWSADLGDRGSIVLLWVF